MTSHASVTEGASAIHKIEATLKILACLVYVLAVVTTPCGEWATLSLYMLPAVALLLLARLPLRGILARSAAVLPFSLMIALFVPFLTEGRTIATLDLFGARLEVTREGLLITGDAVLKSWLSVLGLVILSATTRPRELVRGLRRLGLPAVMAGTLFLTLRYLVLFAEEARQLERARRCRAVRPWHRWGLRSAAAMVTSLFLRACETGERVHLAMLSRGFDGEVRKAGACPPSFSAVAGCCFLALVVVAIRVWGASW